MSDSTRDLNQELLMRIEQQLVGFRKEFDEFRTQTNSRFDAVESRLDAVESRLYDTRPIWTEVLSRIEKIEKQMGRIEEIEKQLKLIAGKFEVLAGELLDLRARERAIETRLNHIEERLNL
jgi:chromosome segregation ATPase